MRPELPPPSWEPRPKPPPGAPNVVVVLLDDTGFAQLGCYGSDIDTPNMDRLAAGGLQFTNFHTTALCSPSRASLMTGRNHHRVGMRHLSNIDTGYDNCRGVITHEAATLAEVLKLHGYSTFALGKWHLANMEHCTPAGPFDHWPLQRGFDRFHGFLGGATDQFAPELVIDNHQVDPPAGPGYHLTADIVDQAIAMLSAQHTAAPTKPFFAYVALGATHSPHQAPPEYIEKYRGRYDDGWDVVRQRWFDRQIALGVVPPETALSPLNPKVRPWSELSPDDRRVCARMQEAFAAFLDHTDVQIGRLIDHLETFDQLDNTIFVLCSDNGASREGGPNGVLNELAFFNQIPSTTEEMVGRLDEIGGPTLFNNYPLGWAQVGNTPLRHYKGTTYEGGIRDPLLIHWPARIADAGTKRDQYHHIIDIAPTIYGCIGIEPPETHRGVPQLSFDGLSMEYCFDDATQPTRRTSQHYEMGGNRAIWTNGWKALAMHRKGAPYDDDVWELYNTDVDFSEVNDLAASEPERLAELQQLWHEAAASNNVLPLDDRGFELWMLKPPGAASARSNFRFIPGVPHINRFNMPDVRNRSFSITAQVALTDGDHGVLVASGAGTGGHVLFMAADGHLVFEYSRAGAPFQVRSAHPVHPSATEVGVRYSKQEEHAGVAVLYADREPIGEGPISTTPYRQSMYGMDIGRDAGPTVSASYEGPFEFTGTLLAVEYALDHDRDDLRRAAEAEFDAAMSEQ